MGLKFEGKNIEKLRFNGKTISKVHYGGELVYSSGLPKGTILYIGNPPTIFKMPPIKDGLSNIRGIRIYFDGYGLFSFNPTYSLVFGTEVPEYIDIAKKDIKKGYTTNFILSKAEYPSIETSSKRPYKVKYDNEGSNQMTVSYINGNFMITKFSMKFNDYLFELGITKIEAL